MAPKISIQIIRDFGWTKFLVQHTIPQMTPITNRFIETHGNAIGMKLMTNDAGDLLIAIKDTDTERYADEMRNYLAELVYEGAKYNERI